MVKGNIARIHFPVCLGSLCLTVMLLVSCGQSGGNGSSIAPATSAATESAGIDDSDSFTLYTDDKDYKDTEYLLKRAMGEWTLVVDINDYEEPMYQFTEGGPYTTGIDIDVYISSVYK
jgi:hypothetical protein